MSNQRSGRYHAAAMNDDGGGNITLKELITFVEKAQAALEDAGEGDAALRFEIFGDYLKQDVTSGQHFQFSTRALGL
jgi:hypothetical protein